MPKDNRQILRGVVLDGVLYEPGDEDLLAAALTPSQLRGLQDSESVAGDWKAGREEPPPFPEGSRDRQKADARAQRNAAPKLRRAAEAKAALAKAEAEKAPPAEKGEPKEPAKGPAKAPEPEKAPPAEKGKGHGEHPHSKR